MKFEVSKSSDLNYKETRNISSLKELIDFMDECMSQDLYFKRGIIISRGYPYRKGKILNKLEIEIYDDWRE